MIKFKWIICPCCQGEGSIENPAFNNGFTVSEWDEMDDCQKNHYMKGAYDVPCDECDSSGKVKVEYVALMTFGEKRKYIIKMREDEEMRQINSEMDRCEAAERAFGC